MLIDSSAATEYQWQQKTEIISELFRLSHLSLTASSDEQDILQSKFTDQIYDQSFDAVFGGLIVEDILNKPQTKYYYKPTASNIFLCELLISADQVFYSGEFAFIAEKIFLMLYRRLEAEEYFLKANQYFTYNELASSFGKDELESILNKDEIILLDALVGHSFMDGDDYLSIEYHRSIRDAAEAIHMHYKHAQVVEYSLLEKLKTQAKEVEKIERLVPIENSIMVNCDLISALTNYLLYSKQFDKSSIIARVYEEVIREANTKDLKRADLASIIHAGILLLQLNFDRIIFENVLEMITKLASLYEKHQEQAINSPKLAYQIIFIESFTHRVKKVFDKEVLTNFTFIKKSKKEQFYFTFLNRESVGLDSEITRYRSKFDPNHYIFAVDPTLLSAHT